MTAATCNSALDRNATDVQAHPAQGWVALDDDGLQTQIGGTKRGRIAAGAACPARGRRSSGRPPGIARAQRGRKPAGRARRHDWRGRTRLRLRELAGGTCGAGAAALAGTPAPTASSATTTLPLDTLSPTLTRNSRTTPAADGNFHRGLVEFNRDQRLLHRDHVPDLDQHLDHVDLGKITDVGHLHFDPFAHIDFLACAGATHNKTRRKSASTWPRWALKRAAAAPSMTR